MLKISKANPRYFRNSSGRTVYLAGSHNWANFKDYGVTDPPEAFDYKGYLDFMERHKFNFFRLWSWEMPKSSLGKREQTWYRTPFPWMRTGPGLASDGKPKFDLKSTNPDYYKRLRSKVVEAVERGMYISVMLFDGYGPQFNRAEGDGFPYDRENNINGAHCGGKESQTLENREVLAYQKEYVKKVIDTVNDIDNIMYEIANEAGVYSNGWQYELINFIKEYESSKKNQNPVGMTFEYDGGTNELLFGSPADWISPSGKDGYGFPLDPPPADGRKVIINDTDHSAYYLDLQKAEIDGQREWVWKNFLRGNNLAFMDPYLIDWPGRNIPSGGKPDKCWDAIRDNMTYTMEYAQKVDLERMLPHGELSSTGYCLADPSADGARFLVYLAKGEKSAEVDLSGARGEVRVEWLDTTDGRRKKDRSVTAGSKLTFNSPFKSGSVLYLYQS